MRVAPALAPAIPDKRRARRALKPCRSIERATRWRGRLLSKALRSSPASVLCAVLTAHPPAVLGRPVYYKPRLSAASLHPTHATGKSTLAQNLGSHGWTVVNQVRVVPELLPGDGPVRVAACCLPPHCNQLVGSAANSSLRPNSTRTTNQNHQDVLGNRKKCEAACKEALLAGRNVVIDRVNFNEQQRAIWVHLGRAVSGSALQLIVLQLVVPIEMCKQRMREEARRAAAGGTPKDTDHLVDRCVANPSAGCRDWFNEAGGWPVWCHRVVLAIAFAMLPPRTGALTPSCAKPTHARTSLQLCRGPHTGRPLVRRV